MAPLLRRWVVFCLSAVGILFVVYQLGGYGVRGYARPFSQPLPDEKSLTGQIPHAGQPPTSFQWKNLPQRYPVSSMIVLPSGTPVDIPRIQHVFGPENESQREEREKRRRAVVQAFERSWSGYKKHAWLHDEVAPLLGGFKDTFGGWGATLVDTLDTLWIMGMEDEFEMAVKALDRIDFTKTSLSEINVFETTIRYLGGFLGAYDISGRKFPVLLEKAEEVGEMLYVAFDTPNRMPVVRWNWKAAMQRVPQVAGDSTLSAEIGSLTLEFTRLSQLTGEAKYYDAVQRILNEFERQQKMTKIPGLWPIMINARKLSFTDYHHFTLGGMSDSLYEYLPKEYMMLGGRIDQYRNMYETCIEAAKTYLFFKPMNKDNLDVLLSGSAVGDVKGTVKLDPYAQHLACFAAGMVGIGAKIFRRPDDLVTARKLIDGCVWAYDTMITKIMPETFHTVACKMDEICPWEVDKWHDGIIRRQAELEDGEVLKGLEEVVDFIARNKLPPGFTQIDDSRYILRPEAIESLFILYRITGDTTLQDKAWDMFKAILNSTHTDIAFSAIGDVTNPMPQQLDSMESFWTAETLKYFYLIFSDPDLVSLDDFVFNTEAHPLRRPNR